jgi:hypothetical protein
LSLCSAFESTLGRYLKGRGIDEGNIFVYIGGNDKDINSYSNLNENGVEVSGTIDDLSVKQSLGKGDDRISKSISFDNVDQNISHWISQVNTIESLPISQPNDNFDSQTNSAKNINQNIDKDTKDLNSQKSPPKLIPKGKAVFVRFAVVTRTDKSLVANPLGGPSGDMIMHYVSRSFMSFWSCLF